MNHFIHREYTVMGGEVHLDIYDDRLTLTSPGGMYSGQMVQDVPVEDISSLRRNPVLADVMARLDYMEKRGSGLKKICNATKALEIYKEGRDPVLKSSVSQFMTVIYSMEYEGKTTGKILSLIAENPRVTTEDLARLYGLTPDGVYYHTKRLREKGVLIREGGRKEGSWIIVTKK